MSNGRKRYLNIYFNISSFISLDILNSILSNELSIFILKEFYITTVDYKSK